MESESSVRGIVEMAGTAHLSSAFSNLGYLEESGEREREVAAPASGREVTSAAARIFLGSSTRIRPRANAAERVAG